MTKANPDVEKLRTVGEEPQAVRDSNLAILRKCEAFVVNVGRVIADQDTATARVQDLQVAVLNWA